MFIPVFLLLTIGASSYVYTSYVMPFISNIVSVDTQSMILIFSCILLLLDNFTLVHDLQNIKPIYNQEHIQIIGSQAIELQKNKVIIYNLTKIQEHQFIYPKEKHPICFSKKLTSKHFSSTF